MTEQEEEKEKDKDAAQRGYGNIYTPHAGAMIIHVQRESGLANRMIILSVRQVRLLRIGAVVAVVLIVLGVASWFYFAGKAVQVQVLSRRLAALEHDAQQLDTLKRALAEAEGRFQQVQKMMGASGTAAAAVPGAADSAGLPNAWPLPIAGQLIEPPASAAKVIGIEIAVPRGTPVSAAGAGSVVEVRDDSLYGRVVRIRHRQGYESLYGNLLQVRVHNGELIAAGTIIAISGDSSGTLPAHLHFEIVRDGTQVNPAAIVTKGPAHGDLQ
jgi:murein DD-endopeptidase MepM/ murein hydrolase activator NlpD